MRDVDPAKGCAPGGERRLGLGGEGSRRGSSRSVRRNGAVGCVGLELAGPVREGRFGRGEDRRAEKGCECESGDTDDGDPSQHVVRPPGKLASVLPSGTDTSGSDSPRRFRSPVGSTWSQLLLSPRPTSWSRTTKRLTHAFFLFFVLL